MEFEPTCFCVQDLTKEEKNNILISNCLLSKLCKNCIEEICNVLNEKECENFLDKDE